MQGGLVRHVVIQIIAKALDLFRRYVGADWFMLATFDSDASRSPISSEFAYFLQSLAVQRLNH